jgi:1,4-dihydroxy-2-naphthoate polyprenyltransferase
VLIASLVCFASAIAAGPYLVAQSGWPLVIIGLASVGAGIAYTGGPWPLAYLGLGEPFVFVFFGLIAVAGTYFVQTGTLAAQAWWAAAPIGSLVTAILVVNNLRDRSTDAAAKKRTLAVRFGARFARGEYAGLVIAAYLAPLVAWFLGAVGPGWLLPLLSLPWAWRGLRLVGRSDDRALNPALGATARLELMYGLLLALGVHL